MSCSRKIDETPHRLIQHFSLTLIVGRRQLSDQLPDRSIGNFFVCLLRGVTVRAAHAPAGPPSGCRFRCSRVASAGTPESHPSQDSHRETSRKKAGRGEGAAAELPVTNCHQQATFKLKPRRSRSFNSLPGILEVFPVTAGR